MVDEYQDTNFIQEQLLFKLIEKHKNICVVGDEDQSLYRFRGATVRNILEFPSKMPNCTVVKLTINYRSHKRIVNAYDRWMAFVDWSGTGGKYFRYDKTIKACPGDTHPDYPAVFSIWGTDFLDEAERFADFVKFLKDNSVIEDYNQVALLLHSVRMDYSGPYIKALEKKGIPVFCPRARAFFDNEEIRFMVACFAIIFGWYGDGRGDTLGSVKNLASYVDEVIVELAQHIGNGHPLSSVLQEFVGLIESLEDGGALDLRPADFFYRLLAYEPFAFFVKNENRARNLAVFSQLLNVFQRYYHYTVVTYKNRIPLKFHFFNSFLRLLYEGGINEYEDPDQPFPKNHVQIMTIHQSKGLEFPVVVVGSLDKQLSSSKQIDRELQPFYKRPPFEPENRITIFDRMRLHYVAFSRPEKILVLTAHSQPKDHFKTIWQGLAQWPYVQKKLLAAQNFKPKYYSPPKRAFSFTGDLKIYETCPRQYQFFREYDFTPSRSAVIFFGLLVHQTIEEIHRKVLDGHFRFLNQKSIREIFENTFKFLTLQDVRPIGEKAREAAFEQVMNYFSQNQAEMQRVIETEVDVSLEKDSYILTGTVDLLLGGDGKLELLDFKTSPRPENSLKLLSSYERQLCTYAYILEKRYGKRPERLLLYWTSEPKKQDALMEFPYKPELVEEAGRYFDSVVKKIQNKDFQIRKVPEKKICQECDLKTYCELVGVGN
jgi:DNA helicase-2/ATP-dependent DNA helicase PcrA